MSETRPAPPPPPAGSGRGAGGGDDPYAALLRLADEIDDRVRSARADGAPRDARAHGRPPSTTRRRRVAKRRPVPSRRPVRSRPPVRRAPTAPPIGRGGATGWEPAPWVWPQPAVSRLTRQAVLVVAVGAVMVSGLLAVERWGPRDTVSFASPSTDEDPASSAAGEPGPDRAEAPADPQDGSDSATEDPESSADSAEVAGERGSDSSTTTTEPPHVAWDCSAGALAAVVGDDGDFVGVPRCRDSFAVALAGSLGGSDGPEVAVFKWTDTGWSEVGRVALQDCASFREREPTFPVELC